MKLSVKPSIVMIFLLISLQNFAQVQTARYVSMISNSNGYYEYLPQGYDVSTQNYPLILFCHGVGELGNGSPAQLPRLFNAGLPKLIHDGNFPISIAANGTSYKFIVISPQFSQEDPTPTDIQGILDYVIQHYRVNLNRIYLTGLSMGGGAIWNFTRFSNTNSNRIAAIVPISGRSVPNLLLCRNIANTNLAVW